VPSKRVIEVFQHRIVNFVRGVPMSSLMKMELPVDGDVWQLLQDEAARSGQPTVSLVSQVLAQWAHERQRQRVADEIAEFAAAHAGSSLDLDHDLETAALEALSEAGQ
jgi:hypothetical protein